MHFRTILIYFYVHAIKVLWLYSRNVFLVTLSPSVGCSVCIICEREKTARLYSKHSFIHLYSYFLRLKRRENWTGGRRKFSSLVSTMPRDWSPTPRPLPPQSADIFRLLLHHFQSADIFRLPLHHFQSTNIFRLHLWSRQGHPPQRHFQRISIYYHQSPHPPWSLSTAVQALESPDWSTPSTIW